MTTLIKNVQVIDGTGKAPFKGDVLLRDRTIVAMGSFPNYQADKIVHGNEGYLCPGFIDVNASSDRYLSLFTSPLHSNFLKQGVTTITVGQCGFSLAPTWYGSLKYFSNWAYTNTVNSNWRTTKEFLDTLEHSFSFGVNIATLAGHKVIREDIIKDPREWRSLSANELRIFRNILKESLDQGAFGFSTGLGYVPYQHTTAYELRALVDVVARAKGVYATHVRDEKSDLLASVQEAIRIAKETSVRTIINHLRPFIGYESIFDQAFAYLQDKAHESPIYFSTNPFAYSVVPLDSLLPDHLKYMGRAEFQAQLQDPSTVKKLTQSLPKMQAKDTTIVHTQNAPFLNGVSLYDFARHRQLSANKAFIELLKITNGKGLLFYENLNQEVINRTLLSPQALIASNSPGIDEGAVCYPHGTSGAFEQSRESCQLYNTGVYPQRARETFSIFLKKMSQSSSVSLESAVARITGTPARVLGLSKRGIIQSGAYADLTLLSRDLEPVQVWVNGALVVEEGQLIAKKQVSYGSILRKSI